MKDTFILKKGISRFWWIPLITGLLSIGLGIWTLLCPAESIPVLAYVFAGCMVFAGVLNVAYAFMASNLITGWGWSLALGLLEVLAGVWLFTLPEAQLAMTFVFVIGVWILVAAINSLAEACMMSALSPVWVTWMIVMLIITFVLAVMFLSSPLAGGIAVWLWLGISFITFGVYRLILSARIKTVNRISDGVL